MGRGVLKAPIPSSHDFLKLLSTYCPQRTLSEAFHSLAKSLEPDAERPSGLVEQDQWVTGPHQQVGFFSGGRRPGGEQVHPRGWE